MARWKEIKTNMAKKREFQCLLFVWSLLFFFCFFGKLAYADDMDGTELEDMFDFTQIQTYLETLEGSGKNLSFLEMMRLCMRGEWKEAGETILQSVKTVLFSEISSGKKIFIQILALGIAGAVFTNFASVFEQSQISNAGFYAACLLLFSLLGAGFFSALSVAESVIEKSIGFMRVLMPSYFIAFAFAGQAGSAVVMYEAVLFWIYAAERLIQLVCIPLLKTYFFLVLAGHITQEDLLSRMISLVEKTVSWGLKSLIGIVMGIHLLQGMILPYADAVKTGTMQKAVQMLPGVGQAAGTAVQMVLGSGVLIRNTIGVTALFILAAICAVPILKLFLLMLLCHLAAAVLQPVCDKRVVSCILGAAQGHKLLLQMVFTVCALFFISIALLCTFGSVTYFSGG